MVICLIEVSWGIEAVNMDAPVSHLKYAICVTSIVSFLGVFSVGRNCQFFFFSFHLSNFFIIFFQMCLKVLSSEF
jgi:hypothetical protein